MNKVDSQSDQVAAMSEKWDIVEQLLGGTCAIRKKGKSYLPQWPNEDEESYKERLKTAVLYPAFKRTVEVLSAKPFSKSITLNEDVPAQIIEWLQDADRQGRDLQAFASMVFIDCVAYGISGVLVDSPLVNTERVRTKADEIAAGVRPYLIHYPVGTVLGWKVANINGASVLTQIRLKETISEEDGEFAQKNITQIRVLEIGKWFTYRENDKKEWVLNNEGTTTLSYIPFVPFYGNRTGFLTGEPPLIELAYQNVQHYQDSSDQQKSVRFARVRIAAIIGSNAEDKITLGADYFMHLPIGSDIKIAQGSAESVAIGRQELETLEEQMRKTGAELLVLEPGQITATQVQSENEANKCALQRIAENFEDALNLMLQYMADWSNLGDGGTVSLYKDFGVASLSDASAQLLLTSATAGKISDVTYLSEMKRRGILSPELDIDEEKDRISEQGPALGMVGLGNG